MKINAENLSFRELNEKIRSSKSRKIEIENIIGKAPPPAAGAFHYVTAPVSARSRPVFLLYAAGIFLYFAPP